MGEVQEFVRQALDWARGLGPWAPAALAGLCFLACFVPMPRSPLGLAAGALLGPWLGAALVSLSSTAGAAATFLAARHLARGLVERRLRGWPRLEALDRAAGRGGWSAAFLMRLTPVPFVATNYALGLTQVSFGRFVVATWLVQLPGTILFASAGAAAASPAPPASPWLYAAGLAALALILWRGSALARRELVAGPRSGP